jgi:succinate dehydrogenase hydrophobic anchor subunit
MQPASEESVMPGWRLIRVTALFLAVLLPLHLAVVVVRHDIGRATFVTVADRLTGVWWPGLEWATLVLALLHGFLVIQARLLRGLAPGGGRDAAIVVAGVTAALLGVGASWAMLTFS